MMKRLLLAALAAALVTLSAHAGPLTLLGAGKPAGGGGGGGISFVSSSLTTYAVHASGVTVTAPSGIQNGDALILTVLNGGSPTAASVTPPSGFTQIGSDITVSAYGFETTQRTYIKQASSESGNYTSTYTPTDESSVAYILVFRGVNWTTGPQDATATTNSGTGTTTTCTGLTTATNGAMLVSTMSDFGDLTNNLSPPSGMTEAIDTPMVQAAYQTITSAGATGNKTLTNNNTGAPSPWGCLLLALKP